MAWEICWLRREEIGKETHRTNSYLAFILCWAGYLNIHLSLLFFTALRGKNFYPCFLDEQTEALRGWIASLGSHAQDWQRQDAHPSISKHMLLHSDFTLPEFTFSGRIRESFINDRDIGAYTWNFNRRSLRQIHPNASNVPRPALSITFWEKLPDQPKFECRDCLHFWLAIAYNLLQPGWNTDPTAHLWLCSYWRCPRLVPCRGQGCH